MEVSTDMTRMIQRSNITVETRRDKNVMSIEEDYKR